LAGDLNPMTTHDLISTYGYAGVLIGTFLEGDIALILGGIFARLGDLEWSGVVLASFIGAYTSDQFFYYVGRHKGMQIFNRRPKLRERTERVFRHLRKNEMLVAIAFRFVYGFRIITPLLIGASGVRRGRFALLNGFGVLLWATLVSTIGYLMGEAIMRIKSLLFQEVKHYRLPILIGALLIVGITHLVMWRLRKRRLPVMEAADVLRDK